VKDFRYASRQLLRQPGFTILAVVRSTSHRREHRSRSINTPFLRPLSPQPEQPSAPASFPERASIAQCFWPRFSAWRDGQQIFTVCRAVVYRLHLTGQRPENLNGIRVTRISSALSACNRSSAASSILTKTGPAANVALLSQPSGKTVSAATRTFSGRRSR
jgi:hypothetical protein